MRSPCISGTSSGVSANSIVTITIKDGSGHTVTVTANIEADGSYSTTADLSALTDGTITVTVAGVDNNKLLIATTDNVIQDAVKGELITIVPNINATNADTVVFSGHTTDVAKGTPVFIRIEDGTGKVVTTTATVNPDGTYSTDFADLNTLTDGVITITGTTTDHNGKALTTTHTDSLDLLSGMITAAIPDVNTANVSAVSISGRTTDIAAGAPILLTIHDKQGNSIVVTTTVTASGTYSVTTNFSGLDDGAITITAVATDNNGNQVVINTHSQLDVTVPTIPLITDNNALGLSGTAEPNSIVTVTDTLGNVVTAVTNSKGEWRISAVDNPLHSGEKGTITATDAAGNTSTAMTITGGDQSAPLAPTVNSNNSAGLSGSAEPGATVTVTDASGQNATVLVDANGQWSLPAAGNPLSAGEAGSVMVTDASGNTSAAITITGGDQSAPLAPIVNSNNSTGLSGTAEPGATVTVTDASGQSATVLVDANGQWSLPAASNPLSAGEAGSVMVTDASGNTSAAITITGGDQSAPLAPIVNSNNSTGLSGTAEPGATVTVTDASGQSATVLVDANGQWSLPAASNPLSAGETGSVIVTDASGNTSAAITITGGDQSAPLAPIVNSNNSTGLSGTAEPGATVTVTDASGQSATVLVDASGQWSLPAASNPLSAGETGSVIVTDASGNTSAITTITGGDQSAPLAPIVNSNNSAGLSGTAEPGATVTVTDASGQSATALVDANGQWSLPAASNPLSAGEAGSVIVTDASGNTSAAMTITGGDQSAPLAPIVNSNNSAGLSGTAEPGATVTVTDASGQSATVLVDANGQWSLPAASNPLSAGETGSVIVTDASGNTSAAITITGGDQSAPLAPIVNSNNSAGLSGTAEPGATVTVTDASGQSATALVDANGQWSLPAASNPLSAGEAGSVMVTDASGNTSAAMTITGGDQSAPLAPIVNSNNSAGLSGTAEPGATVTVTDASGQSATALVDANGQWSLPTASNPLSAGEAGSVMVTDASGNTSAAITITGGDQSAPLAATVNNNSTGLSGTAEPGATVTVTDASGQSATVLVDANGQWSLPAASNPLSAGETGSVIVTDASGNTSAAITITGGDQSAPLAATVNSNNSAGLSGTAEPGATVTVTDASGQSATALVDANGQWSLPAASNPLSAGEAGSVMVTDASGNTSAAMTITGGDQSAPLAPIVNSNNSAGLSGTAEPGATVTVTDASGQSATALVDANGQWSLPTASNPLSAGEAGSVMVTDASGNTSAAITITGGDQSAPLAPTVNSNNSAGLSGTAEPGATVTVTDASGQSATVLVDANGQWSLPAASNPLSTGEAGSVIVTDASSNTSAAITITGGDQSAPLAPIVNSNNSAGLSGTAEPGATVTVTDASGQSATVLVDANGQWSLPAASNPLSAGEAGSVMVTDASGNTSAITTITGGDQSAPLAPIVNSNNSAGLSGTAEPGATVTVTDTSGQSATVLVDANGQWSLPAASNPLSAGEAGSVIVTDASGNTSAAMTITGSDQSAPLAATVNSNNSAGLSGTAEPGATVTVTDASGQSATVLVDASGQWSLPAASNPLSAGEAGSVMVTDASGNTSAAMTITGGDQSAPLAPIVNSNNSAGLSGTAEPGATVTVTDASGQSATVLVDANGQWSLPAASNPLSAGEAGSVMVTDASGNTSAITTITGGDQSAPLAPTVNSNNSAGLSGTAEPGATVTVTDASGQSATVLVDANGQWSLPAASNPLSTGEAGSVIVTDASSNTSAAITITGGDQSAPLAPIVNSNNSAGLSGTAEPGATVTVTDASGQSATVLVDANGQWSLPAASNPLSAGEAGSVMVTDASGNTSAITTITGGDQSAPLAPIVNSNNSAGLSGTAEPGATVTVTDTSGQSATVLVDANGQWSLPAASNPLSAGETGSVMVTDASGNTSAAITITGGDQSAPLAATVNSNNSAGLSGTAEPGATVTVTDASGQSATALVDANGQWSLPAASNPLSAGEAGSVMVTDASGNTSAAMTITGGDQSAPLAPIVNSNNSAGLSGTAEPGATVTVTDASGQSATVLVDANGQWSLPTASNPLSEGEAGSVMVTDASGNTSAAITITGGDQSAPLAPTVNSNNSTGLSGTAEPGATVTVTDASGQSATVLVDANGQWSLPAASNPLSAGEAGSVIVTDASSNTSAAITITGGDQSAPLAPIVNSNNSAGLSGTAEPGATVTVTDASGQSATVLVDANGQWSLPAASNPLSAGEAGSVMVTDASGNTSAITTITGGDQSAPLAPIVNSNNSAGLSGTAEPGATVTVTDTSGQSATVLVDANGQWSLPAASNPLSAGETGSVMVTDASGNTSAAITITGGDQSAPLAATVNSNNSAGLSGTAEPGATVTVTDASGQSATALVDANGQWSLPAASNPLSAGEAGSVMVTDASGNTSAAMTITGGDQSAPLAPIVNSNNSAGLSGTAEPGATVTVTDASGQSATVLVDANGQWSLPTASNPLSEGEAGSVMVTDASGNTSAAITITGGDQSAPLAPTVNSNNSTGLSGTAEPGATVTVTDASGQSATVLVDANGQWSLPAASNPLSAGEAGSVIVTDASSNTSAAITITGGDQSAPLAPIVNSNNSAGLSGTAEPGATVTVTDTSGQSATVLVDANGQWSLPAASNPLSAGETGSVMVTDASGNTSAAITITGGDQSAPLAATVNSNNSAGLSGTAEPGATVTVTDASGQSATALVDANGQWSLPAASNPLSAGEAGSVMVTDASGNTSAAMTITGGDQSAPLAPTVNSNNSAGLSGTAEPGATVTVTDASGQSATVLVDANGQWSLPAASNPLSTGEAGSVIVTDASGNTSAAITITGGDQSAPLAPIVNSNNSAGLSGTAEPGATVTVTDASGQSATVLVDANGQWSLPTASNPLSEGEAGSVMVTDASGNTSAAITITGGDQSAPLAPTVNSNNSTGLSGTAEPGATVTVTDASGQSATVLVDANGQWSLPAASNPLSAGEAGSVMVTDASGNTSAAMTITGGDQSAPLAPIVNSNNSAGLSGTAEPGATVTVTDTSGQSATVLVDANGQWSLPAASNPLSAGETGSVMVTDASGNTSAAITITGGDQSAPLAPTVNSNNSTGLSGTAEPGATVTVTDASGQSATVLVDANGQWSLPAASNPLSAGEAGSVIVTDASGNTSAAMTITGGDQSAPLAPIVNSNNSAGLSGTAEPGATVTVTDTSGQSATVLVDANGQWSLPAASNPLSAGETGSVMVTDASGNTSAAITITGGDQSAPLAPIVNSNNSAGLSGTAEPGATVTVTDASGQSATALVDANGQWSLPTASNPLSAGEAGSVMVTDASGNTSAITTITGGDQSAPLEPIVITNNAAGLAGTSEPNATLTLVDAVGNTVTTTADSAGLWSISGVNNPLSAGEVGSLTVTDAAGNTSAAITITGGDQSAPLAPILITNNASGLAGTGEPDTTLTLVDAAGNTVTTTVGSTGLWGIPAANNPLSAGEVGSLTVTDAAGNTSTPMTIIGGDQSAPLAPIVITNNAAGLAGTGEPNTTLTLIDAAGTTVTTTVDSAGLWSIPAVNNPLSAGEVGSLTVTDAAGNTSTPMTIIGGDQSAPLAPIVITNNASGLTGTGEPNTTLTLIDAAGTTVTTTVDSAGLWSIPAVSNPLSAGGVGSLTVTDAAGNTSTPMTITGGDQTPPVVLTAVLSPSSDSGVLGDNITSDDTPTISGTGDPGSTIAVSTGPGQTQSTTVDGSGNWSVTPAMLLNPGTNVFNITEADAAGNTKTATLPIVIDTSLSFIQVFIRTDVSDNGIISKAEMDAVTPPVSVTARVTFITPSKISAGDQLIIMSSTGPTQTISLSATDIANGHVDVTVPKPNEDETISVGADLRDNYGHSIIGGDNALLDTTPSGTPTVEILADINNDGYINMAEHNVSGDKTDVQVNFPTVDNLPLYKAAQAGDTITLYAGGNVYSHVLEIFEATNGYYVFTNVYMNSSAGPLEVTARLTDTSPQDDPGWVAGAPGSDWVVFNTNTPTIAITRSGSGNLGNGATETITFTLSENSTDFSINDVSTTFGNGATLTGFNGSGRLYTATLTMGSSPVTISVASNAFSNMAGSYNLDGADTNNSVTVMPANDAPVNTVPTAQVTNEDTGLVISGLSVSDVDAGTYSISVALSVAHGTLHLATGTGVTLVGNDTSTITITGSQFAINNLLTTPNSVTYNPSLNYNGTDTLTMLTNDGGNIGVGGVLTDSDTVALTINAVNDTPVLSALVANQAVDQSFAVGTAFSYTLPVAEFSDVDTATDTPPDTLTLSYTATDLTGALVDLSSWLIFDPVMRKFTVSAGAPISITGAYNIDVIATDSHGTTTPVDSFTLSAIGVNFAGVAEDTGWQVDTTASSYTDFKTSTTSPAFYGRGTPGGYVDITGTVYYWDSGTNTAKSLVLAATQLDPDTGLPLNRVWVEDDNTWNIVLRMIDPADATSAIEIPLLDQTALNNTSTAGSAQTYWSYAPASSPLAAYNLTAKWSDDATDARITTALTANQVKAVTIDSAAPDMAVLGSAGAEQIVNTNTVGNQWLSRTAALADGSYIVVWLASNYPTGTNAAYYMHVMGQRYDKDGNKVGDELVITSGTTTTSSNYEGYFWAGGFQNVPNLDVIGNTTDAGYTVSWSNMNTRNSIISRSFDANNVALSANVTVGAANAQTYQLAPHLTTIKSGPFAGLIIDAWAEHGADAYYDVALRAINSSTGAVAGAEYKVEAGAAFNTTTKVGGDVGYYRDSATGMDGLGITALKDGTFVVVYQKGTANLFNIYAEHYSISGTMAAPTYTQIGSTQNITTTIGKQGMPQIATLENGGYVVVWNNFSTGGDVKAQRFTSAGTPIDATPITVNTNTASYQGQLGTDIAQDYQVTGLKNGGYVVVWGAADKNDKGIYMTIFDAAGNKMVYAGQTDIPVNTFSAGSQMLPDVTALNAGGFEVTWSSNQQDKSLYTVVKKVFDDSGAPQEQASIANDIRLTAKSTVAVTSSQTGLELTNSGTDGKYAAVWLEDKDTSSGYGSTSSTSIIRLAVFDSTNSKTTTLIDPTVAATSTAVGSAALYWGSTTTAGAFNANEGIGHTIISTYASSPSMDVIRLKDGGYTVAVEVQNATTAGGRNIKYQLFNNDGTTRTAVLNANTGQTTDSQDSKPALIELLNTDGTSSGQFAIAYEGQSSVVGASSYTPTFEIFSTTNGSVVKTPTLVTTQTTVAKGYDYIGTGISGTEMDSAALSKGGFVITWADNSTTGAGITDATGYRVLSQRYNNTGTATGSVQQVNTTTTLDQRAPDITSLSDGGYLISWVSTQLGATNYNLYQQRYDMNGVKVGIETMVSGAVTGTNGDGILDAGAPTAANIAKIDEMVDTVGLAGGGWAVAYVATDASNPTTSNVYVNVYDAAGNTIRNHVVVNSVITGEQFWPTLSANVAGGFTLGWTSAEKTGGNINNIKAFDAAGQQIPYGSLIPSIGLTDTVIESGLLIGGSTRSVANDTTEFALDSTYVALASNHDTLLYRADVSHSGTSVAETLTWDATKASAAGLTVSFDAATHTLTAVNAAGATLDKMEDFLRSVSFHAPSNANSEKIDVVYTLYDSAGATTSVTSGIAVIGQQTYLQASTGTVSSTSADDVIDITSNSVVSVASGAGNDKIILPASLYSSGLPAMTIDGGTGTDELTVGVTAGATLTLSDLVSRVSNIEVLNLSSGSANTPVTLNIGNATQVASILGGLSAETNHLIIKGDTADTINLPVSSGYTRLEGVNVDGTSYSVFTTSTATDPALWIADQTTLVVI